MHLQKSDCAALDIGMWGPSNEGQTVNGAFVLPQRFTRRLSVQRHIVAVGPTGALDGVTRFDRARQVRRKGLVKAQLTVLSQNFRLICSLNDHAVDAA
ncbi:hypothetical protein GOZ90_12010 [Agrobacterium vitis]|uniref:Uncharacterized protein n=1 Tax=Agrobacterium vitis TaxID=373 RepID=A0A6I4FCF5_AGRVI|nr:hypothetical protein [Agrobacterium vitis]MCF1476767.1 hypothetical protein [Agrobacterium vitis]MUZ73406.1 hypothetical protein [Agrobacterium vitis]MUZ99109.1 hypothetical protein [Agrobacterium vitis]MVA31898.1 hypothetical protein [Agrobacterium vitis]MVA54701.1 hypothetical protein [Agrobacterium vitis]